MYTVVTTPPALEPLTVAEVRAHLRIGSDKVQTPPAAPTVALVASAGNVTAGEHRYRVTFINVDGESDAGEISAAVIATAGSGQVNLSDIPTGDDTVTARRIYRTRAGGSVFYLLAGLNDNTSTTYTDNIADGSLGNDVTIDTTIAGWIAAARARVEGDMCRPLIAQDFQMKLDRFPCEDFIDLKPSLISIASVQYIDENGVTQTWASSNYEADTVSFVGRVVLAYNVSWPTARYQRNAVTVNFRAGYGETAADVPGDAKQAMKLLIGHWYQIQLGTTSPNDNTIDRAYESLLTDRYIQVAA